MFGTNSEANSLSADERIDAARRAASRPPIDPSRMMPGTGCCALTDTVRLTEHAVKAGCAGVLMLPPFYYKDVTEEGLYRNFSEVVERVGDARLQNLPLPHPAGRGGRHHAGAGRAPAEELPTAIAGMKDSSGDWNNTKVFLDSFAKSGLRHLPGQRIVPARRPEKRRGRLHLGHRQRQPGRDRQALHRMGPKLPTASWRSGWRSLCAEVRFGESTGKAGCGARRVREKIPDDQRVEAGHRDLREGSGVGEGAAAAGGTHGRAGQGAGRGPQSDFIQNAGAFES